MAEFILVIDNGYEEIEKVDLVTSTRKEAEKESMNYVAEHYPERDESWTLALKEIHTVSTF